jgi:predicted Fe-Mo cluster-binding NifX family protein
MKKIIFVILTVSLLMPVLALALAEEKDKIAIATDEKTPNAPVSNRMGRSPFYVLYDEQGNFVETIENPFKDNRSRPTGSMIDSLTFDEKGTVTGGITTPSKDERDKTWNAMFSFFAQKRIKVIVAEEFGDEIVRGFKAQGISCVAFKGRAEDAVKKALLPAK